MLRHLPIIILTSLHPIAIANTVPKFDIARECQSEGGTIEIQKRGADDETQARNQLQTEWLQFSPRAKTQCNGETGADNTYSYVEFLTCLEMERDVKTEREPNKTSKSLCPAADFLDANSSIAFRSSDHKRVTIAISRAVSI